MDAENVQSPFLPNTNIQYAWDSTSLGYLKTCPRLYYYHMIEGWASEGESVHLRFGIEFHRALQDYDMLKADGAKHDEAVNTAVDDLVRRIEDFNPDMETKAGKYKNQDSLVRLVVDYLDYFKDDPAKTYIMADGSPAVELSFRFELDLGPISNMTQPYLLCGHLDRIVDFQDNLYVMDRKTTTTTPSTYYFNQWSPSNQMTLYTLASQIILDSPIKGVIIDAAQVLIGSSRFVRGFTYRTPDQLDEWLSDLGLWLERAETYATNNYWPQNDTACDKFGGCRFQEVCSKSPKVRTQFLKSSFVQQPPEERWNPLRSR
jgi:hypothetical protein